MTKGRSSEPSTAEARITAIKDRLKSTSGGAMVFEESAALSDKHREEFWRRVIEFEEGPFTTDFERLTNAGVELPVPESLDDPELASKLWEVISSLARMRVYISHTDHLSDRELYAHLWSESLREEVPTGSNEDDGVWHLDLLARGSHEDTYLYLRFHADEKERQNWLESFPECSIPPHEEPPFDRDRRLPKPDDHFGVLATLD